MPDIMPPEPPVLRVEDLTVRFRRRGIDVAAVNGVSFALARGETLTILGESGSGKSVSLKALMGLLPDYAKTEGNVWLEGRSVLDMPAAELARLRGGYDLDDLPGADGGARSGLYHRRADRRDDRAARRHRPRRRDEACARSAGSCEDPVGGAAVEELPARNVGRHAAAGDDRAGACLLARPCCWPTNRPPRWMSRCRSRSCCCCASCSRNSGWRSCSSPTMSAPRRRSPIVSR